MSRFPPPHYQLVGTPNAALLTAPRQSAIIFFPPEIYSARHIFSGRNICMPLFILQTEDQKNRPKGLTVAAEGCSPMQELVIFLVIKKKVFIHIIEIQYV